jgi:hypothetical protein
LKTAYSPGDSIPSTGGGNRQGDRAKNEAADTTAPALLCGDAGYDPIEDRLRQNIRATIEALFEEELAAVIGRCRYDRGEGLKKGCRHGHRKRQRVGTFRTEMISVTRARNENEEGKNPELAIAGAAAQDGDATLALQFVTQSRSTLASALSFAKAPEYHQLFHAAIHS